MSNRSGRRSRRQPTTPWYVPTEEEAAAAHETACELFTAALTGNVDAVASRLMTMTPPERQTLLATLVTLGRFLIEQHATFTDVDPMTLVEALRPTVALVAS